LGFFFVVIRALLPSNIVAVVSAVTFTQWSDGRWPERLMKTSGQMPWACSTPREVTGGQPSIWLRTIPQAAVTFLFCHAIELYLKAYLRGVGRKSVEQLKHYGPSRRKFGESCCEFRF
jgi:hypothetical protein